MSTNDEGFRQSVVVMVEPISFYCNEATAVDNYFQQTGAPSEEVAASQPLAEHRSVYEALRARNIDVTLFRLEDEEGLGESANGAHVPLTAEEQRTQLAAKPDSIFPNNSISFHELPTDVGKEISSKAGVKSDDAEIFTAAVLYPMCSGRRNEIPRSLLDSVKATASIIVKPHFSEGSDMNCLASWSVTCTKTSSFRAADSPGSLTILIDFRAFENIQELASTADKGQAWALEGTGSLNFSADGTAVFATVSQRCHPIPFHLLCEVLMISPTNRFLIPQAVDAQGRCVYHTNVVGWVGDFGLCAWTRESLVFGKSSEFAQDLYTTAELFDKVVADMYPNALTLSLDQLKNFSGNAMYLRSVDGVSYVAMSWSAAEAMTGSGILERLNTVLAEMSAKKAPEVADGGFVQYPHLIVCRIPSIERLGGGSVRCLLAASLSLTQKGFDSLTRLVRRK